MCTLAERKVAAVLGAACADAAAQPLHWIYNPDKLDALLYGKEEIEFRDPSANPFYCLPTGRNTCYGDQAYALLESLVEKQGFNKEDYVQRLYKTLGPDTEYDNERVNKYRSHDLKEKLKWGGKPVTGPWRNGSIKDFLRNVEEGKPETGSEQDQQIDGITKLAPVVALYAGRPECMQRVEDAIRVTQNEDFTVAATLVAARILEQFILRGSESDPKKVVEEALALLSDATNPERGEFDTRLAGVVRAVLDAIDVQHRTAVTTRFKKD